MKNLIAIIIAVAIITAISGCKTTEENYRAAYELAKQKNTSGGIDSTIYSRIRNEARPQTTIVNGDTLNMKSEYVRLTPDCGDPAKLHRYNVVIAQFKQLFNAKSVRKRAIDAGFADALIVQTREPLYYVIAVSSESISDIKKSFEKIQSNPPIVLKEPCPFILRRR